ncbi:hypothetical protein HFP89_01990 [Wenzhouxiangella sp. XN79A]|uniref:hypothetical protein n=1 Tax=Wenzhouxiangella sp. XN79A TaxID=2724193 RepID=UPI00144A71F1|nr:hypothetical protein [Wenzhouxiangella sp. XN79A]NKI33935.1 hypothetical protein [Wenzhouxiangella sp. XN79A]
MIRPRFFASIAALVLLVPAGSAGAQSCRPELTLEPPVADQWLLEQFASGQQIRIPFRIELTTSGVDCGFLVGFDLVHSSQVDAHVERRPFSPPLLDVSAADPRRLLGGTVSRDRPISFDLDLVVTPAPGLSAGRINIQLTQRAYSGSDPASATETDRIRERVALDVPAGARLRVRSDAGEQPLDSGVGFLALGNLVSGGRGRAWLTLDGNVPVTLDVVAANGALVHEEFPEYTVPYTLSLGGVAGAGNMALETRLEPGDTVTLDVDVGELERLVAGDYQDVLRITIRTD